jgi:NADP-dependent 3-hydroxy acid dehydrogenase YdfG
MPGELAGRTALVTGGSRGIGLETARLLAASGSRVILIARDENRLREAVRSLGDTAAGIATDLGKPDELNALVARLSSDGISPDILVNNAGAFGIAPIEETSADELDVMLQANVAAPFLLTRALLAAMRERSRGDIVTVGSIADRHAFPGNAAYAATKHAARAMHEVLRLETKGTGVRASLVSPAPVDTALWDPIDPDNREGFTARAQMLTPRAVAEAILWIVTRPPEVNVDELRLSRA